MPVGRELDPVRQTRPQIGHEGKGLLGIAPADAPRDDELAVDIERGPSPGVARPIRRGLRRLDVLGFNMDE